MHQVEAVLKSNGISYSREKRTEYKSKPDFLFPSIEQYWDKTFPADQLTMLGVKYSCKDRWRQVLTEAQRVKDKHLLTFEPSISVSQTTEMQAHGLQLVVPSDRHPTFQREQQAWLLTVAAFLSVVKARQPS